MAVSEITARTAVALNNIFFTRVLLSDDKYIGIIFVDARIMFQFIFITWRNIYRF